MVTREESSPARENSSQAAGLEKKPRGRRRRWLFWSGGLVGLLFLAVTGWLTMIKMPGETYRGELPPADDELLGTADSLRATVTHLAEEIGERNVSHRPEELALAADWIANRLATDRAKVNRQEYQVSGVRCANLEVEFPGTTRPEEIVLVGAHYDSAIGTSGANDNTTGVAALLELARRFSDRESARTVRFVAFVNEEPPYFQTPKMGSRVYAARCGKQNERIVAMLSLETIGYYDDSPGSQKYPAPFGAIFPSEGNFIAFIGNVQSGKIVRRAIAAFRQYEKFPSEGAALPRSIRGIEFSDHWAFWEEGYPALMITDTAMFRYPYYHHPEDTVDKIDFERAARVVRGLEKVVEELAGRDTPD